MRDVQRLRWVKGSEPWTWDGWVGGFIAGARMYRVAFKFTYWEVLRLGPHGATLEPQETFGRAKAYAQRD